VTVIGGGEVLQGACESDRPRSGEAMASNWWGSCKILGRLHRARENMYSAQKHHKNHF
jgi:hypothetical protein